MTISSEQRRESRRKLWERIQMEFAEEIQSLNERIRELEGFLKESERQYQERVDDVIAEMDRAEKAEARYTVSDKYIATVIYEAKENSDV